MSVSEGERRRLRFLMPLVAVFVLWAYAWPSLRQVNVTWDEALGDLFFGQRYLSYFLSFDPVYLDFAADPYPEGHRPDLRMSPFRGRPWEYYPFANTLAAACSVVLSGILGWADSFDGFHAVNLLFLAFLVPALFLFVERRLGLVAATMTIAFLFGSPRIIGHLLANIKDFPSMCLFALAALLFFRAFESGSSRQMILAGCLVGLSLATKANALFFPLLPLLMLLLGGLPSSWTWKRLSLSALAAGVSALTVMLATWPYLWQHPVAHFLRHLQYLATRKGAIEARFEAPVLEAILYTTPPLFLAAFALGLAVLLGAVWRRQPLGLFLLAWLITPLARYALPQATNFDGGRHFLEIFPAMAIVAGWGVSWLSSLVARALERSAQAVGPQSVKLAFCVLLSIPGIFAVLASHPFHLAYWNVLVGGLSGARAADLPQASDYWGSSYRLGLDWLNQHAEPNADLVVPVIEHAVRLVAPERLRPDIRLLPVTTPYSPQIAPDRLQKTLEAARRGPLYIMFVERRDWLNPLMVDCLQRLEPAAVWSLDGAPVLFIYRYQPPPLQPAL